MIAARGTRRCRPGSPWRRWGAASGRSANDRGHNAWAAERRVREWRTGMTISDRAEAGEGSAGRASGAGCLCVGVVILAKTVTTEMGGGLPGEELMVCMTLLWREADSNFQFPATVSFVKPRYSSFFCREGADVARSVPPKSGTTSSNPVPSSEESCELQYRRRSDPHSRGRISHQPRSSCPSGCADRCLPPPRIKRATRCASVLVLPVPAPAAINSGGAAPLFSPMP